jgi:hypothetical protein
MDAGETNDYALTYRVGDDAPEHPWAMYLATPDGRYRYLAFDLDTKKGNAPYDAGRLSHWLDELNIPHLVCVSGPKGGRHLWIAIDDPGADPGLVATIAHLASQLLRSLDVNPLVNPATGCVRPPYTPHREGGRSEPQGDLAVLAQPVNADQLLQLRAFLVDAGASLAPAKVSLVKGMAHDTDGHPHLIGAKRDVSSRMQELLNAPPAEDTSRTLAAVLVGCARARWRYADVQALAEHSPAFEHARTRPGPGDTRYPRSRPQAEATLTAEWSRAVYFAAQNPPTDDVEDPGFTDRAGEVSRAVSAVQSAADAHPGRWGLAGASRAHRGAQGRPSHRAVLDAVCLYIVQAARLDVEVSSRRLSEDTAYGRTSCDSALIALSTPDIEGDPESAWLVKVADTNGVHGARYRLSKRFSTETENLKWAQAAMRPAPIHPSPHTLRTWWITHLSTHLATLTHDVFAAPHSLGRTAGRVFAQLPQDGATSVPQLARAAGLSDSQTRRAIRRLHGAGLAGRSRDGWSRKALERRDEVAQQLGVAGYLVHRAWRYSVERARWAAWCEEVAWLRRRRKPRRGSRHGRAPGNVALFGTAPPRRRYSRDSAGVPDHRAELVFAAARVASPGDEVWQLGPWSPTQLVSDAINEIRSRLAVPDAVLLSPVG